MLPLIRTSGLARRPVVYRDIRLGLAVDALFDRGLRRLVGLEVLCGDERDRFLPFPACEVRDGLIVVESALVLLDANVEFYRLDGSTFAALRDAPVLAAGREIGNLLDLLVRHDGEVARVVLATSAGSRELDLHEVTIGDQGLRPAV